MTKHHQPTKKKPLCHIRSVKGVDYVIALFFSRQRLRWRVATVQTLFCPAREVGRGYVSDDGPIETRKGRASALLFGGLQAELEEALRDVLRAYERAEIARVKRLKQQLDAGRLDWRTCARGVV